MDMTYTLFVNVSRFSCNALDVLFSFDILYKLQSVKFVNTLSCPCHTYLKFSGPVCADMQVADVIMLHPITSVR